MLAGHGFIVAVPENYHSTGASGWIGEYANDGADEGNKLKVATTVEAYDGDSKAVIDYLKGHQSCTKKLGAADFCIGGHLSIRSACVNSDILAVASWYPTDMHTGDGVCAGITDTSKDTMSIFNNLPKNNNGLGTELLLIYGKQDKHVDGPGRLKTYKALTEACVHFEWLELNGMHAFMRDEGYRYDPYLEMMTMNHAIAMFNRKLHEGDIEAATPSEKGTLNAKM